MASVGASFAENEALPPFCCRCLRRELGAGKPCPGDEVGRDREACGEYTASPSQGRGRSGGWGLGPAASSCLFDLGALGSDDPPDTGSHWLVLVLCRTLCGVPAAGGHLGASDLLGLAGLPLVALASPMLAVRCHPARAERTRPLCALTCLELTSLCGAGGRAVRRSPGVSSEPLRTCLASRRSQSPQQRARSCVLPHHPCSRGLGTTQAPPAVQPLGGPILAPAWGSCWLWRELQ